MFCFCLVFSKQNCMEFIFPLKLKKKELILSDVWYLSAMNISWHVLFLLMLWNILRFILLICSYCVYHFFHLSRYLSFSLFFFSFVTFLSLIMFIYCCRYLSLTPFLHPNSACCYRIPIVLIGGLKGRITKVILVKSIEHFMHESFFEEALQNTVCVQ